MLGQQRHEFKFKDSRERIKS